MVVGRPSLAAVAVCRLVRVSVCSCGAAPMVSVSSPRSTPGSRFRGPTDAVPAPATLSVYTGGLARCRAAVWLDLYDPAIDDLTVLTEEFGLHPLAVEDAVHDHGRPNWTITTTGCCCRLTAPNWTPAATR